MWSHLRDTFLTPVYKRYGCFGTTHSACTLYTDAQLCLIIRQHDWYWPGINHFKLEPERAQFFLSWSTFYEWMNEWIYYDGSHTASFAHIMSLSNVSQAAVRSQNRTPVILPFWLKSTIWILKFIQLFQIIQMDLAKNKLQGLNHGPLIL